MLNKPISFFIVLTILCLSGLPVLAYELDMSVDEEIKKKYNSSKLNYDVPALPKVETSTSAPAKTSVPKTQPSYTNTAKPVITVINKKDAIIIRKWTKFHAKSNQTISDYLKQGISVTFTTTSPVFKKYITIPAGSKISGVVTDSHRPQISGNGGLVVIRLTALTYNGKTYEINGKITKANYKKIFLNNIKGKHQYWSGVDKQVDKGTKFYKKTRNLSKKWADNPVLIILSPAPTIVGIVGSAVTAVISPITGLGTKGGNLSIPAGSQFEIKLLEDTYISN